MLTNIQVPKFNEAHVMVIGDVMLDRYWHGQTSRISPEAPVPVVHVKRNDERPGGAGNVALNLAALGAKTTIRGLIGQDEFGQTLTKLLLSSGINCDLEPVANFPTITKLRVLCQHQQLIRLDFEESYPEEQSKNLLRNSVSLLESVDVIILSDYSKGTLNEAREFIAEARSMGKVVLVDPKGNDFSFYHGASIITPNFKEFEAVVGPCRNDDEIATKGLALIKKYELQAILVTRGERGMTLLQRDEPPIHLPTQAREVFDVTGAGDTVISMVAAALATGADLATASFLANVAAGLVVAKLGAACVTTTELLREIRRLTAADNIIVNEKELKDIVLESQAHGERIVMTNGCFDILHPGHIAYLEQARKLGHRLIVAVNNDDSVKRLKGDSRPINNLQHRMQVLAGLSAVDWIVPFSEDTPERLYSEILPDILVKGGDYQPEEIAGAKAILANGGEVKILDYIEGCSTTSIIEKAKAKEKE